MEPAEALQDRSLRLPRLRRARQTRSAAGDVEATEFPPAEFDEGLLRDALHHEAGELEAELRERRVAVADEQLDTALVSRVERPTHWCGTDQTTGRKFVVELVGNRPSEIQFREPFEEKVSDDKGGEELQVCFERYVRRVDVSGDRPIPIWERRDLLCVFDGSGEVRGHRPLPPESLTPDQKDELSEMIRHSEFQGTVSR